MCAPITSGFGLSCQVSTLPSRALTMSFPSAPHPSLSIGDSPTLLLPPGLCSSLISPVAASPYADPNHCFLCSLTWKGLERASSFLILIGSASMLLKWCDLHNHLWCSCSLGGHEAGFREERDHYLWRFCARRAGQSKSSLKHCKKNIHCALKG